MFTHRPYLLVAVPVLTSAAAVSATEYDVVQIPQIAGWNVTLPTAANDHGHIVGIDTDGFWSMPKAFYFDGTTNQEFGLDLKEQQPYPDWAVGIRPKDINNHNHVLLTLEIVDVGGFDYIWDGEDYHELAPSIPPGNWHTSSAGSSAINNHGVVVGTIVYQNHNTWTMWSEGYMWDRATNTTTIIEPPAPFTDIGLADISDTGYITGFVWGGPEPARAFIWNDGAFTLFPGIDESDYLSIGNVVNNHGFGGAFSSGTGSPSMSRVFLWSAEGIHSWSYPTGNLTAFLVFDINDNNDIVGTMLGPQQAFLFRDGEIRNLNDHVTSPIAGTVLDLWDAVSIDPQGRIVAQGQYLGTGDWNNYTFVLTPRPSGPIGDLNGDGVVDAADLLILLSAWGECGTPDNCPADLDGDGIVNAADLLILLGNWG